MAKISKRLLNKHNEAVEILKQDTLSFNDREFVFENYHEGAGKMNNLISAHFTPPSIALSMIHSITHEGCFVDLCAGIGMLAYKALRFYEMGYHTDPIKGVCIENCTEYYEVGKKLLPEFLWINGDIFDPKVIQQVKDYMNGDQFSIISNPPYGIQVKTNGTKELLKYSGPNFEYKAIELGAILGAFDGAFLIPQQACPFRMSGKESKGETNHPRYRTELIKKFEEETEITIDPNNGFSTDIIEGDQNWKDVSIVTEIAYIFYENEYEWKYVPKEVKEEVVSTQQSLF